VTTTIFTLFDAKNSTGVSEFGLSKKSDFGLLFGGGVGGYR